jgi:hypothetical protein
MERWKECDFEPEFTVDDENVYTGSRGWGQTKKRNATKKKQKKSLFNEDLDLRFEMIDTLVEFGHSRKNLMKLSNDQLMALIDKVVADETERDLSVEEMAGQLIKDNIVSFEKVMMMSDEDIVNLYNDVYHDEGSYDSFPI